MSEVKVHKVKYGNTERYSFSKIKDVLDIPYLIEVQKDSYIVVAGGIIGGALIEYFSALLTDNTIESARLLHQEHGDTSFYCTKAQEHDLEGVLDEQMIKAAANIKKTAIVFTFVFFIYAPILLYLVRLFVIRITFFL